MKQWEPRDQDERCKKKYSFHKYQQLPLSKVKYTETRIKLSGLARDLSDKQYGHLTVLYPVGKHQRYIVWLCECICGTTVIRATPSLRKSTENTSCGCMLPIKKLTEEEVLEIKKLLHTYSDTKIARKYGVERTTIRLIRVGQNWKHL